ncbi:hypothetical protein FIE12Z_12366 [Fusarium flagelliforme]|uniref:Uncharacterized protein n=1 Tax=Fusarium flagelliforme TaxID=2675880 RepID=A0A395M6B5_9HYPO|nr:hypothetical protein FIE12Z_12366 [Fusarium flagelliforme]
MFTANFSSLAKSEATKRLIAQLVNEKLVAISLPAGVDQSRAYITGLDDTTQWMTLPVAKGLGLSTHFRPNDFEVPVELCSDGREMIEDDPGSIFAFVASWFPCDERTKLSIVDELRNSASMLVCNYSPSNLLPPLCRIFRQVFTSRNILSFESKIMASAQEAEEFIQSLNGNAAARAVDESPFILFKIYPDKIVIDCNHDDFTKADLHAICQQGSGGQMKGANFKSIVAATDKVHIKSGNFSFEFENNIFNIHADVMRPAWVTPTESVPEDSSRVTLFLPGQDSEEETQKLRDIISSQFERLDEPSILFLQDLISMSVEYFNEAGKLYRSKDFRKHQVDAHRVSVKVTTVDGGLKKGHTQLYHVTEQATADKSMQVILAFPLWDNFKVGGDTCAFGLFNFVQLEASPLRFYVHSDFNFDNQHGPISPSTRTVAIKDLVASAFVQAVLQFCEHPTLRYHWPLFLMSGLEDSDAFWSSLEADIRDWIAQNPVLISRNNKHWRHISHLTILVADAQDEAGNPLLDDEITDPFVSNIYPSEAVEKLESYGLASFDSDQLLKLLELRSDVPCSERHKIHRAAWADTFATHESWSQAFARLVSKALLDKNQLEKILCTSSAHKQNEDLVFYVRSSILDRFSTSNDMSLSEIKRYLVYLYVTHQSSFLELKQPYHSVKVMTIEMQLVQPRDTIVYMPNIDLPYGPEKLLGSDFSFHNGHLHFLHRDILNEEPTAPRIFHPSWKDWLCDCLGIRQRLSLLEPRALTKPQLSWGVPAIVKTEEVLAVELRFVLEKRPDQFLGFIQYLWASDGPRVMKSPSLVPEIQGLPAQSLCTGDRSLRLQDTWVPLKVLRESVWHYMESPDEFPFLDLGNESAMDVAIYTKWDFLVKDLGVKRQNDMAFLLEILNSIKLSCRELSSWQTEKVFDLYTAINKRLQLAVSGERGRALAFFEDSGVLYIREAGPIWTGLSSCRWNAPANLITKYSLETLLRRRDAEQEQMDSLSELFRVGMSVTDVSVKDLVEELLVLRNEGCEDVARVTEIYKYLDESLSATDEIRTAFEECAVILVKKDSHCMWLKTSQCFWSEAETAPLNSSLRGCYSDLESFFIDKLRIKVSAYDKLLTLSTDTEDHSMVQGLLLSLMDETKGSLNEFPPAPMHKVNIFEVNSPQRSGQPYIPTKLCSVDTDFAIGDRPEFRIELAHDIKMLAYDLKVVRRLQPLFRWLSIEDRYLSRCVKERLNDVFSFRHGILNLRDKAHQIARVGKTFNCYGSKDDALSLYQQLQKAEVVQAVYLWTKLEVFQDGQKIQSRSTHRPVTWISEDQNRLTIYISPDTSGVKRSLVSALPKRLQEWLMKDTHRSSGINEFEVANALTSIFNASGPDLDRILWEQGIVEVPFENVHLKQKKAMIKVRLPQVDEREPCTVTR